MDVRKFFRSLKTVVRIERHRLTAYGDWGWFWIARGTSYGYAERYHWLRITLDIKVWRKFGLTLDTHRNPPTEEEEDLAGQ